MRFLVFNSLRCRVFSVLFLIRNALVVLCPLLPGASAKAGPKNPRLGAWRNQWSTVTRGTKKSGCFQFPSVSRHAISCIQFTYVIYKCCLHMIMCIMLFLCLCSFMDISVTRQKLRRFRFVYSIGVYALTVDVWRVSNRYSMYSTLSFSL